MALKCTQKSIENPTGLLRDGGGEGGRGLSSKSLLISLKYSFWQEHNRLSTVYKQITQPLLYRMGCQTQLLSGPMRAHVTEAVQSQSISYMRSHWSRPQFGLATHAVQRGCVICS